MRKLTKRDKEKINEVLDAQSKEEKPNKEVIKEMKKRLKKNRRV